MSRIAGLGMDLADMERVRQALRKNGEAFALRICTPDEWAYCRKHADPVPHLAARFAAKEAESPGNGNRGEVRFYGCGGGARRCGSSFHSFARGCGSDRPGAGHYGLVPDHDPFQVERRRHRYCLGAIKKPFPGKKGTAGIKGGKGSYFLLLRAANPANASRDNAAVEGSGTAA